MRKQSALARLTHIDSSAYQCAAGKKRTLPTLTKPTLQIISRVPPNQSNVQTNVPVVPHSGT